jgi:ketosteroid isomerase-like protein
VLPSRAGDVAGVLAYHHPDVMKALGYGTYLKGIEALRANLQQTLSAFNLEFTENILESTLFVKDAAIEQSLFAIRSTPKRPAIRPCSKGDRWWCTSAI